MTLPVCPGFQWSGVSAGIKPGGDKDLGMILSNMPARAAAVFTKNRVKAAPVQLDLERIVSGICQAVIVNSGNANCCTGEQGMGDARLMTRLVAEELGIDEEWVLVASTGVIGVPMPMDKVTAAVPKAVEALSPDGFIDFATSILTTDQFPKTVTQVFQMDDGSEFSITAAAKGAGMIHPDMATMLCFVCTDIQAAPEALATILGRAVDYSFNRITVDGDTSTNDTVMIMASGMSEADLGTDSNRNRFQQALDEVLLEIAKMIVRDGEGATKLVEVNVRGAHSAEEARRAAQVVAGSPLVKTAFFGEDVNWGRIMAAVGRSGVEMKPEKLDIFYDTVQVVSHGRGCGAAAEAAAGKVIRQSEMTLVIDLNTGGTGNASMFTSDLTLDYVKLNAHYRS
ncbi:MAG: bifunctional glutamate N-acetyltransferase/amino-acid acetyltransferase ArgJ [Thermodesulfobacteriota bacterium]